MSLKMTTSERKAFLADVHVGVISVERDGKAPLSAPIWYAYEPDADEVWLITAADSLKGRALASAKRFSLVAQTEQPPYAYVSVEGPVTQTRVADREKDSRPMAQRYLGRELGDRYVEGQADGGGSVYVMRPEVWRTTDYSKLGA